jgi:hypothetical protein
VFLVYIRKEAENIRVRRQAHFVQQVLSAHRAIQVLWLLFDGIVDDRALRRRYWWRCVSRYGDHVIRDPQPEPMKPAVVPTSALVPQQLGAGDACGESPGAKHDGVVDVDDLDLALAQELRQGP